MQAVAGTTNFGGGALSGATSNAFFVDGGAGTFTYSGTLTSAGTGRPATIQGKNGGAVTLSGNINATGLGLLVQNNTGGTYTFSGGTKTLGTTTNDAVTLSTNTGATINFPNGGLAITTTSGRGFRASGGGTVSVGPGGSNNTVSIGTGESALWLTGMTVGVDDITFASVSGTGTTTGSPLCIQSTTGSATQTINVGTLSIAGTAGGPGMCVESSSAPVTITSATINNTAAAGIQITSNTAAVDVAGGAIGATNDPTGNVVDVDGGSGAVTIAAALTKNTAGRIAEVTGHSGGTVSFTGSLSCTSTCTGINAASNTGGTIEFTHGTKTLNTGASNAVTLATNNGATISFTNGGLALTTTSGRGVSASGGGILNISGTNNTITTTGAAPAFELLGTSGVHFGAGTITFETINKSGGGTKGVSVQYYDGSFAITGDDGADGNPDNLTAGGTITGTTARGVEFIDVDGLIYLGGMTFSNATTTQNVTGSACGLGLNTSNNTGCNAPIYLESTSGGVTLRTISVNGSVQGGINGYAVTNLNMSNIEVQNVGNEVGENGILMKNLMGTGAASGLNIHDNEAKQLHIINAGNNDLASFTVSGSTFANAPAPNGGQGVLIEGYDAGTSMTVTVNSSAFTNLFTNAHQVAANSGSALTVTLNGSTITNANAWTVLQASDGGTLNYTVTNNSGTTGALSGSGAINVKTDNADLAGTPSNATGTISGNTIGGAAVGSGAVCGGACAGISVHQEYGGTLTANIIGNTIRHVDSNGIYMTAGNSYSGNPGKLIVTITGNLIKDPDGPVLEAIQIRSGKSSADNVCVQATIGGTTNPGAWPSTTPNAMNRIEGNWDFTGSPTFSVGGEIFLWERFTNTSLYLPGYTAPVSTFLGGRNSITSSDGTNIYSSGTISSGNCP